MWARNGKSDWEMENLDVDHELPAPEGEPQDGPQTAVADPAAAEVAPLQAELAKLTEERNALLERVARLQAEFENARKRAAKEQQDFKDFALADAIKNLLPILDSFDRALATPREKHADFRAGVELINKQLHDAMAKLGLRPVPAKDEPFDPRLHEAIEMVDTPSARDNHVLDELQRGYKLKERLLRPAMVRVARNPKK
jgi:molecular chaperone GrpE